MIRAGCESVMTAGEVGGVVFIMLIAAACVALLIAAWRHG